MTRVLSALVLLPIVVGAIWYSGPATGLLATITAVLAFIEYRRIAKALGANVPGLIGGTAVALACLEMWGTDGALDAITNGQIVIVPNEVYLLFLVMLVVVGAVVVGRGVPGPSTLADAAATVFAPIYIGLPLGALAAVRGGHGAMGMTSPLTWDTNGVAILLLLLVVIVVSDSGQYYTGRAFGRRPLAPRISPKKTVEGAIGGVIVATAVMAIGGHYVFESPIWMLALLGAVISMLGIVGDLFESLLKRSAGVKDSSNLIPGHGGVLDRIDSWLFAAPVYYVFVRFIA
jgi:phosphatidate cytidylyltransferase